MGVVTDEEGTSSVLGLKDGSPFLHSIHRTDGGTGREDGCHPLSVESDTTREMGGGLPCRTEGQHPTIYGSISMSMLVCVRVGREESKIRDDRGNETLWFCLVKGSVEQNMPRLRSDHQAGTLTVWEYLVRFDPDTEPGRHTTGRSSLRPRLRDWTTRDGRVLGTEVSDPGWL